MYSKLSSEITKTCMLMRRKNRELFCFSKIVHPYVHIRTDRCCSTQFYPLEFVGAANIHIHITFQLERIVVI